MPPQKVPAPGTRWLMKKAGMREMDKRIKNNQRGGTNPGSYNRPHSILRDGKNFELNPALYSDTPVSVDLGSKQKPLLQNDPESPDWVPDGLTWDRIIRQFDYERAQWRRQGFTSPYKLVSDRKARYEAEFKLWLHWHHPLRKVLEQELCPRQEEPQYEQRAEDRNGGNDEYWLGRPPRTDGRGAHGRGQQRYPWQRYDHVHGRSSHRTHQTVDVRDPRNRPPPAADKIREVFGHGLYDFPRRRDGPPRLVYEVPIAEGFPPSPEGGMYDLRGGRAKQQRFPWDEHVPMWGRRHPVVYDDYVPENEGQPVFTPRRPRHHPEYEEEEEEEEEGMEEIRGQLSDESFVRRRLSADILYPDVPPYHGRPLGHGHRNEDDTDDEDGDEQFRMRDGFMGRRRVPFGLGRDGGHFRLGPRGYDREYGFSGDEDEHCYDF
ncbi:MAG: hypothetical protein ASARMPREDX12_002777 [Alectoria sarmentosa]|nr:MAG: hypothetical protein ASARMPREDX12_002777 [Alectoria sarmentosa]